MYSTYTRYGVPQCAVLTSDRWLLVYTPQIVELTTVSNKLMGKVIYCIVNLC